MEQAGASDVSQNLIGPSWGQQVANNAIRGLVVFIGLVIMMIILVKNQQTNKTTIAYSEFFKQLEADNVASAVVEGSEASGDLVKEITGETGPIKHFRVKLATDGPVTPAWLGSGAFEVDVAGERYAVRPSLRAPLA